MRDDVDLRADDLAVLDKCSPARVGQRARVVGGEDVCALHGVRLAVLVELLEGCLVNGK